MRLINFLFLVFLCSVFSLQAQNDFSSSMLTGSWQAMQVNPAQQPKGLLINLPGLYSNTWMTNVTFSDLIKEEGGNNVLDIDNAISLLTDNNILQQNLDLETIGVAFRLGPIGINIGHRTRFNAQIDYPKILPQLIWQGNAQFIGQTVAFGPSINIDSYHEWALGASMQLGDNIRAGAKVKFLSGISSIQTAQSDLELMTDEEIYQLNLQADFLLNTSGSLNYDGLNNSTINLDFGKFSTDALFSGNSGMAIDLGASIDLNRIQINISALDLGGKINWKDNPENYSLQGNFEFEGLDIASELLNDGESFTSALDSLEALYDITETNVSFSTELNPKYYLQAQYALSEACHLGLILFHEASEINSQTAAAVTGSLQLSPILRLGALYGYRNERFDNLGLNASAALGPIRLHLATDNIIAAIRPKDVHAANVRLGLNIVLGQSDGLNGDTKFY